MNKTKLEAVYKAAYKKNRDALAYYTLDQFIKGVELLKKDIVNRRIILHVDVSRSGMTRRMNFYNYHNMPLNILYHQTPSFDPVRVGGCGMDMIWHLLYTAMEVAGCASETIKRKDGREESINSLCSRYQTL